MTTTAPTTDHHDPVGRTDYLSREHVERYRFAAAQLQSPPLRILDVASGTGYGTAALASRGHVVSGVDCEPASIELARRRYPETDFVTADGRDLPFPGGTFDAVVSFETVEHVVDGRGFLAELHRVLTPGGRLISSTPNIRYTAHPPCHLKEYEPEEFFALVGERFEDVERHAQYFRLRDRARDLYSWHLQRTVLRVADGLGVRPLWRSLRGKDGGPAVAGAESAIAPGALLDGAPDPSHCVQRLDGEDMLRIMIAVATK